MIDHRIYIHNLNICEIKSLNAFFNFYGYTTNSQCEQLPDGLTAQHCTGIAEFIGSNPVQA